MSEMIDKQQESSELKSQNSSINNSSKQATLAQQQ